MLFVTLYRFSIKVAFIVLISSHPGFSQENIRFERISTNEGLSQADVRSIVQDKSGFLWIGTRDGLNRYDGLTFRNYVKIPSDSASLTFNQIWDLEVDSSGNIWIASTGGLAYYDYQADNFRNFFFKDTNLTGAEIIDIFLVSDSGAILSTNKGLFAFDLETKSFSVKPVWESFAKVPVLCSYQSGKNGTWVGTNEGLFIQAPGQSDWIRLLEKKTVNRIYFDSLNSQVYLSSGYGLFRCDPNTRVVEQIILPAGTGGVSDVIRAKGGNLWIACDQIVVLDENDLVKYVLSHDQFNYHSLSENRAKTLFQSQDGVIWIGTIGYGLNKFNPDVARFSYLSEQTSVPLSTNYVSSIASTDDATLLVGTSRGLNIVDLKKRSARNLSMNAEMFRVIKVKEDSSGNVWVAGSLGLFLYVNKKLILKSSEVLSISDISEWDEHTLILATLTRGIFLFDKQNYKISQLINTNDLPEEVSCILPDANSLWIGCKDGLRLFSRSGRPKRHFTAKQSEPKSMRSAFVKCVFKDSNGNLWVGTWGGGLSLLNATDSTFTTMDVSSGLANNVVYGILEDGKGNLWMSTNFGISVLNQQSKSFKNFDYQDGLQSNEFNTGAYFRSKKGIMYFGGINGVSFFDPVQVLKLNPPPPIIITSLTANNKPIVPQNGQGPKNIILIDRLNLSWKENNIGLGFTVIDLKRSSKYAFQYSLGDAVWRDIGNRRNLELINLSSGIYQIKFRAKTPGDDWGENIASIEIEIIPPFWATASFKILIVMILLGVGWGFYRFRLYRLEKLNNLLNKLVDDRTKEINQQNEEIQAQNEEITVQYESIASQNEELKIQSEVLSVKNALLEKQRVELLQLSSSLEKRVDERTRDITILNLELVEQNKQFEQFSYITAHHFRSPIARLKGLLSIMPADASRNKDAREILELLKTSVDELDEVTSDVNKILNIQADSIESFTDVDLLPVITETVALLDNEIAAKNISVDIESFFPVRIRGPVQYVKSIFFNLVQNAVKFSQKKSPLIKITCAQNEEGVIIKFIDNGIGIDLTFAHGKIFQLYQKFSENTHGRGFGLFLVKTQVEHLGGAITIESTQGIGTTFTIHFPLMTSDLL